MYKILLFAASVMGTNCLAAEINVNALDAGKVRANNQDVVLLGNGVALGQAAPNFKVVDEKFTPVELSKFKGKPILISTVPSLDTGICSLQTKYFNDKVAEQYPNVVMLTISADLPFAQKRFCNAEGISNVKTLSDSVWRDFAINYGVLIENMGLLARGVFILDKEHKIIYKQLVPVLSKEPDYISVEAALKILTN